MANGKGGHKKGSSKKGKHTGPKKDNVEAWQDAKTHEQNTALGAAAENFDEDDALDKSVLEAVYGQESGFGADRRSPGAKGAAGDFQMDSTTAGRYGLDTSKKNDERFDVNKASDATARYLKDIDGHFSSDTTLTGAVHTTGIDDENERVNFDLAAYNAGEARVAKAQAEAQKAGKDPTKWDDVKGYLTKAGATGKKAKETKDYVDKVRGYAKTFEETDGHWVTLPDGRHVHIDDDKK